MRWILIAATLLLALSGIVVLLAVVLSDDDHFEQGDAEASVRRLHERLRPDVRLTNIHCERATDGWRCSYRANGEPCTATLTDGDHPEGASIC